MGILRSFARFAVVLLAAGVPLAQAQQYTYEEQSAYADSGYGDAELDQMLAPVALYPDELLSQVLMAATYPLEVVQAARWSRAHPDLQGEDAVQAVDDEDWDPSVKSLVAFPNVLAAMSENLDWTQRLGEAFLASQDAVMAGVQRLRRAAFEQGTLSSTDEMVVSRDGDEIALDSPSPDTMYVPYYDPRVVYGTWWWPSYPPVYWAPWPDYYVGSYGFGWSLGIPVGVDFFFADFDWRRHRVHVDHRPFYFHDRDRRPIHVRNGEWRWDPHHRRSVPFHNPVARQEFGNARAPREVRRPSSQAARPSLPLRPGEGVAPARTLPVPATPSVPVTPSVPRSASPLARPSQAPGYFPQQQRQQQPVRPATPRNEGAGPISPGAMAPRAPVAQPALKPLPVPQAPAARQRSADQYFSRQPLGRPQAVPQPAARAQAPAPAVRNVPAPAVRTAPPPAVHPAPAPAVRPGPAPSAPARVQQGGGNHSGEGAREGPRER